MISADLSYYFIIHLSLIIAFWLQCAGGGIENFLITLKPVVIPIEAAFHLWNGTETSVIFSSQAILLLTRPIYFIYCPIAYIYFMQEFCAQIYRLKISASNTVNILLYLPACASYLLDAPLISWYLLLGSGSISSNFAVAIFSSCGV